MLGCGASQENNSMISRKVERKLNSFFAEGKHSALLVDGARQVGKTFIIEEFV